MSTRQIHRMLDLPHKTAWFMTHRIREALKEGKMFTPLGGTGSVVEVDETYVGGKAKNRMFKEAPRSFRLSLLSITPPVVSRRSTSRTVTSDKLRDVLFTRVSRKSTPTREAYARHETVIHSGREYVNKTGFTTNHVENFFSILKRGIFGVYHHVSEAHLHRYLAEFDFRYNTRYISDTEPTEKALEQLAGKRLIYITKRIPAIG